jgi:hypothetical protein
MSKKTRLGRQSARSRRIPGSGTRNKLYHRKRATPRRCTSSRQILRGFRPGVFFGFRNSGRPTAGPAGLPCSHLLIRFPHQVVRPHIPDFLTNPAISATYGVRGQSAGGPAARFVNRLPRPAPAPRPAQAERVSQPCHPGPGSGTQPLAGHQRQVACAHRPALARADGHAPNGTILTQRRQAHEKRFYHGEHRGHGEKWNR